jgi:hypothetical protein
MKTFYEWLELKLEEEQEQIEKAPKVLWITGMNSSGMNPLRLSLMGYDVKSVGTTTNRYAAYLGRIKRYPLLKSIIGKSADKLGQQHINVNVKKHALETEYDNNVFAPDVVVGSSQGGAIVMQIAYKYPKAKFVLAAPAWKIFGATYKHLPKDTIILHGTKDFVVPVTDSEELESLGFEVHYLNCGHSVPLTNVRHAIDTQLNKLGISILDHPFKRKFNPSPDPIPSNSPRERVTQSNKYVPKRIVIDGKEFWV